jgi:hypothetical protein
MSVGSVKSYLLRYPVLDGLVKAATGCPVCVDHPLGPEWAIEGLVDPNDVLSESLEVVFQGVHQLLI